jgi:hypothetical protein
MKVFRLFLFILGLALLGLNIFGLFKSLRNPELDFEKTPYKNDLTVSFAEARENWFMREDETEREFAIRVNKLVNHTMAHYWKDEGIIKYHIRVPVWENYILNLARFFNPDYYRKYEFRNYKKAIERGVGICSQPSIALKDLLNENGIDAEIYDLAGHVVVPVKFKDGTGCVLDPDYGRYVPYDIEAIEANPELVREPYNDQNDIYASYITKHKVTDDIVNMYEKSGNHIYYMPRSFEDFSYIAIWIIPFLLMLPCLLTFIKKNA